jgi:hypothetical protein
MRLFENNQIVPKREQKKTTEQNEQKHKHIEHVYEKGKRKNKGKNVIADNILSKTACVIKRERSEHSVIANNKVI